METKIQELLGTDKSNPLFEVYLNLEAPNELLVYFGFKLLETVSAKSFQEKLLLARLINADYNQTKLHEAFGYDIKTMKRWGTLLKCGSTEAIQKIADGQGSKRKVTEDKLASINYLYKKHLEEQGVHIISYIAKEYEKLHNQSISIETIRTHLKPLKKNDKENNISSQKFPMVLYSDEMKMKTKINKLFIYLIKLNNLLKEYYISKERLFVYNPESQNMEVTKIEKKGTEAISKKSPEVISEKSKTTEIPLTNEEVTYSKKDEIPKNSPEFPISENNNFPLVDTLFKEVFACHHIGLLLARIFIDSISSEMGDIKDIVRQWICMILSGCQNIEQGRKLNYRALSLLIGKQKKSSNRQRERLKEVANMVNVRTLYRPNIKLVKAEYDNTFLLDPHGVGYTGQLKLLLCWLGGIHQTAKGYYLDLIHTLNGEPIFSKIDDNYFDLRQRFHSTIKEFRRILGGDKNRDLTIVVDRAIYDVGFMREARNENIFIITWEKNYKKGEWDSNSKLPKKHFAIQKYRNSKEDSYLYNVKYVKNEWSKDKSFAQYIILLEKPKKKPIELSIICTDYDRDGEKVIKPILTRWLQENDMSYLISLGINFITSYDHFSYEDIAKTIVDREVKNKKLLKLISQKNKLKNKLGRKIVDREDYIEKKDDQLNTLETQLIVYEKDSSETIKKKIIDIKKKIKRIPNDKKRVLKNNKEKQELMRNEIVLLEQEILPLEPNVSRLETLIKEEYIKLNFMPKSFMDAIKIISRNIIYELLNLFRPIWNNYRNDHVILKELLSCVGFINETEKKIYIKLNPTREFPNTEKQKILLFLFEVSTLVNKKYKLHKTIIITLYEL